jgi:rhodanese-related sulfurtransferase
MALVAFAVGVGLGANAFRREPLPLIYQNKMTRLSAAVARLQHSSVSPASQVTPIPERLSLEQISDFAETEAGLILDARPSIFYRLGHIPGALSLPRDDFEAAFQLLQSRIGSDHSRPLVIYCTDESCADASLVKKALTALGYSNVGIFAGGWREWTGAGKATISEP